MLQPWNRLVSVDRAATVLMPEDMWMSVVSAAIGGHADVNDPAVTGCQVDIRSLRLCCCREACLGPWSCDTQVVSMAHVTPKDCVKVSGPCCCQSPCGCSWSVLPQKAMLVSVACVHGLC